MEQLKEQIRVTEEASKDVKEFDVVIQTGDDGGDGYAFIFIDDEGKYDVSYLQDRIPTNAWFTPEGCAAIQEIMDEGKQCWSKEKSLYAAVNEIFNYWCTPDRNKKFVGCEVTGDNTARLVLSLN